METLLQLQQKLLQSRRLPFAVIGVTLAVLAGTVFLITFHLRDGLRQQVAHRDAEILHAVTLMHQVSDDPDAEHVAHLEHPVDQLTLALQTSRLKGVLATRLYDRMGRFVTSFPPGVSPRELPANEVRALQGLSPQSAFRAKVSLATLFPEESESHDSAERVPLLEVIVPLHYREQREVLGMAEFVLDGQGIAAEYARLDRNLVRYGILAFLVAGGLLVATMGWAFRRLQETNHLLSERTASLLRANHELNLAAKTSAVGAVTAHLIHGLINPLFSLQTFISKRAEAYGLKVGEGEWQWAVDTTRRMQMLVDEIVRVLGEERNLTRYEVALQEFADLLGGKLRPVAEKACVTLMLHVTGETVLINHEANLLLLVLENLARNAIQASAPKSRVWLSLQGNEQGVRCEVRDEGPGLPEHVREHLFVPCHSTKPGGNGIGLAISKQLAKHLGAELELVSSGPEGTCFRLSHTANHRVTEAVAAVSASNSQR